MEPFPGRIDHDYKNLPPSAEKPMGRLLRLWPGGWPWLVAAASAPLLIAMLVLGSAGNETAAVPEVAAPRSTDSSIPHTGVTSAAVPGGVAPHTGLPDAGATSAAVLRTAGAPHGNDAGAAPGMAVRGASGAGVRMVVDRGDSLGRMFRRHGLSLHDLSAMAKLPDAAYYLRVLNPGDEIVVTHDTGRVQSLEREIDEVRMLRVVRLADDFRADMIERPVETRTVSAHSFIRHSLFAAAQDAGIADSIIMQMADIFQWDIDFLKDVRAGDEFMVIYEELWREGEKLRNGKVLAAEFVNRGLPYRAARYLRDDGAVNYLTPEGRSVRKAFLRAPVDFTRISSAFDLNRRHPILNTIRAHRGVDYAAPTGTPVRAAGDGTVHFRGSRNGFGNTIVLEHGGRITTLYAHLSRFADIRVNDRVRQGQTIGYVGMTGLATGPHLHYEYQVNGVHQDPQTAVLSAAEPTYLAGADLDAFRTDAEPLWRRLDRYRTRLFGATASSR